MLCGSPTVVYCRSRRRLQRSPRRPRQSPPVRFSFFCCAYLSSCNQYTDFEAGCWCYCSCHVLDRCSASAGPVVPIPCKVCIELFMPSKGATICSICLPSVPKVIPTTCMKQLAFIDLFRFLAGALMWPLSGNRLLFFVFRQWLRQRQQLAQPHQNLVQGRLPLKLLSYAAFAL